MKLLVSYTALPGADAADFVKAVREAGCAEAVRKEPGCIRYDYFLNPEDSSVALLVEEWESAELQSAHEKTETMKKLIACKEGIIASTEVAVYEVTGSL